MPKKNGDNIVPMFSPQKVAVKFAAESEQDIIKKGLKFDNFAEKSNQIQSEKEEEFTIQNEI